MTTSVSAHRVGLDEASRRLDLLASLLEASLTLPRALAIVSRSAPLRSREWLGRLADDVREGRSLSAACERAQSLPPEAVALLRAAEAVGGLSSGVRSVATLLTGRVNARRRLLGALAYPALLLVGSVGSAGLLIGVVLPRFALMLSDLGQQPPALTLFVLHMGRAATWLWAPAVLALAASVWCLSWTRSSAANRLRFDELSLRIGVIGELILRVSSSRICLTLSALLGAGVSLAPAMRLAAAASGNAAIAARALAARQMVIEGASLSSAFRKHRAVSTEALELIVAGEESGRVSELSRQASTTDALWVEARLAFALRTLEPTLIIGFGLVIATIAGALLQAVYAVRPIG